MASPRPLYTPKIRNRLLLGFIVIALLGVDVALITLKAIGGIGTAFTQAADETLPLLDTLTELRATAQGMSTTRTKLALQYTIAPPETPALASQSLAGQLHQSQLTHNLFPTRLRDYQLLTERISPVTRQLAARVSYNGERLSQSYKELLLLMQSHAAEDLVMVARESLERHETEFLEAVDDATAHAKQLFTERRNTAHGTIISTQKLLILAGALTFGLALLIGAFTVQAITAPISRLKQASAQISAGDLDAYVDMGSNDELGELAQTFNGMARALKKTNQDIANAKAHLDNIIASMADALIVTDEYGLISDTNQAALDLLGYSQAELSCKALNMVLEETAQAPFLFTHDPEQGPALRNIETHARCKNGDRVAVSVSRAPLAANPHNEGKVFLIKDLSERQEAQSDLHYMATHDMLTLLPNRLLFTDRLTQALTRAPWRKRQVAVLMLDLDRFKIINNSLGHETGDKLLKAIAERLPTLVRVGDTVARLGGDEYALLLTDLRDASDVAAITEKIINALSLPLNVDGREFFLTASIGASIFPADGQDAGALLRNADTALARAKEQGKNTYQIYSPTMTAGVGDHIELEVALRRAMLRNELVLHYQPQIDLRSSRVIGVEALLRWNREGAELLSPQSFIALAEETGLIVPIGEWVLHHACLQARRWHDAGLTAMRIAVNLSDREFKRKNLIDLVRYTLKDTGLPPQLLELELTEGIIMQNADTTIDTLHELKAMGVQLSIDDFGTGYSSLSYLKRLPLNALKVDRSFVKDIPGDPDDMAITATIIAMAHTLRLKVVAEGVEDEQQLNFLREHQCDVVQGYFYSRAVPATAIPPLCGRSL